jgi:hemerythrin-like domain-containing protein
MSVRSTEELVRDHEVILGVLDGLEARLRAVQSGGTLDPGYVRDAVAFSQGFVDRCHHGARRSTACSRVWSAGGSRGRAGPSG